MSNNSESRAKMVNPLLVKAGIPAAMSVAAYICSRIISKRPNLSSLSSTPTSSMDSRDNHHFVQHGDVGGNDNNDTGLQIIGNSRSNLEGKLLELETYNEGLQQREMDLKRRLLRYQEMKKKELILMELRSKMMLEKMRAEFLLKEVSLAQDESQRMGSLLLEYVKLVHQLEESKEENRLIERKAKKLCKRARQRLKVIREQKLKIEARDEELISNQEEIQSKDALINELEDEISQMKEVIDHLQREKIETSTNNVDIAEKSYSLDPKNGEAVTKEEHDKIVKELEQLQKDREAEANEVAYLRWSNACLRHELSRCHELKDKGETESQVPSCEMHEDDDNNVDRHGEATNCDCNYDTTHHHPTRGRRHRFIEKVKKWVEGGKVMDEKEKDNNHEVKSCFGGNHVSNKEAEDLFVPRRLSCSSV